jgi:hypothetical protein
MSKNYRLPYLPVSDNLLMCWTWTNRSASIQITSLFERTFIRYLRIAGDPSLMFCLSWFLNEAYSYNELRSFGRSFRWWRISDSNRWPPACKAGALASWANPPGCLRALNLLRSSPFTSGTFTSLQYLALRIAASCVSRPEQIWTADPYIISVVL